MAETLVMVGVRTLGKAIALHFAAQGWKVICAARTRADVEALAAEVKMADGELDRGYAAYVRGTWNLLKAVGPVLVGQGGGTFLQIGTSSGVRTTEGFAGLGTVQHGLRALVQVAAREWRSRGVH